uniref:Uncharacterized protein n=1 Tax=Megaselia scalaris TaxID=36166 RepID=T1GZK3_MEGSC
MIKNGFGVNANKTELVIGYLRLLLVDLNLEELTKRRDLRLTRKAQEKVIGLDNKQPERDLIRCIKYEETRNGRTKGSNTDEAKEHQLTLQFLLRLPNKNLEKPAKIS